MEWKKHSFLFYTIIYVVKSTSISPFISNNSLSVANLASEKTVTGSSFKKFHNIDDVSQGSEVGEVVEFLVRLKGVSDGHIALSENAAEADPLYLIVLGSYANTVSEIRRSKWGANMVQAKTPDIMSDQQFRGFLIKLDRKNGELLVYHEGSEIPLLHWVDPLPLHVQYLSFAAYDTVVVQVAFNCKIPSQNVISSHYCEGCAYHPLRHPLSSHSSKCS